MTQTRLRPMTEDDLELVLAWRNAPEVRDFMLTQQEITLEDHRVWFAASAQNPARALLIFETGGKPAGHMNFKIDLSAAIADWGFYAAPGAPKGTGRAMGASALEYGFATLGLHKICGQVLDFNRASLAMHEALGFVREGVLREQQKLDDAWHDLVCYGLLAREWAAREGK